MILGNDEIQRRAILEGLILPFDQDNLQPASYDCCLSDTWIVDGREVKQRSIQVFPKQFLLASTREWVNLDISLSAYVEGKSSWGRVGLFVQNAGFIDPGFKGQVTLELYNASDVPVKLRAGMPICQLVFHMVCGCSSGYNGHYLGQSGATRSKLRGEIWA